MTKMTEYNGPYHSSESHLQSCVRQLVRGAYTVEGIFRMAIVKQRASALHFRQSK